MDTVSRSGKIAAPLGSRRGRMVDLGGLVEQAMESIEAWMADHPGAWVALSGGKDSTVVAHLARRVDPSTPHSSCARSIHLSVWGNSAPLS